ncbi:MAG TPA: BACON domain-containing protein, partial [Bryobacteraceae bacterium]|nr:BACON domain-containing protein [Bryobacteraceae bacterium]
MPVSSYWIRIFEIRASLVHLTGLMLMAVSIAFANSSGPPLGKTGAPGEATCASCHSGPPNTKGGNVKVSFPTLLTYAPGISQLITVQITAAGANFGNTGFEVTIRRTDTNQSTGMLNGMVSIPNRRTSVQSINGLDYVYKSGINPEQIYQFMWTPTANVGNVTLYVAAVAGGNLATDEVYTAGYTLTPNIRTYPSGYRWEALPFGDSATGLSNDGRIVGTQGLRGFLRNADAGLVTIEVPGAVNTRPAGVNSSGAVVGSFGRGDNQSLGFTRSVDGSYAVFEVPGASTAVTAISDSGEMVGSVTTGSTTQGVRVALVSGALQVTEILPRVPFGVNAAGIFVGTGPSPVYAEGPTIYGYLQTRDGNVVSSFPSPCGGSLRSTPFGPLSINDLGDVASFCTSPSGYAVGDLKFFVRLADGRIAILGNREPFSGSPVGPYLATGINRSGQILGVGPVVPGGPDRPMLLTPCGSTVPQSPLVSQSAGGTFNVSVTSGSDCHWLAYSDSSWVTLDDPTGPGNGTLGITVAANLTISARAASLTVGGNMVTVTQEGIPCTVTLNSQSTLLGPQGGSGLVGITAPVGCGWTATSSASWITFPNGASGSGSGNLSFAAAPNPGTTLRTGTITLGGNQFLVNEVGAATCTYSIAPFVSEFPSSGGSGGFNVITGTGCTWTVTNTAPWISFPGSTSGSGNGTVLFTIAPSPSVDTRSAQLNVAGTSVGLVQAGNAVPPNGLSFVPVIPCRVADTRLEGGKSGVFGPPLMIQNTTRDFPIPSSGCGIPSGARAYSLNVTVVPSGPLGFVTVWPAGEPRPNVSTLNAFEGQVVANAAIVPAGSSGGVSVYSSNDTHLIIDINGYFTQSIGPDALVFYSLPPCRLADTRTGSGGPGGAFGPPSLLAN